ncbi:CRE-AQP-2 protein [Aphelenchoides avenae]|nr:CRE-AQP-2 protein [Aphelenchus avenae]
MEKAKAKLTIKNELARALIGEFLGTLVLVLVINCVVAQSVLTKTPPKNTMININLGVGLGIAFGIAICAKVSGGHINPAVSLMFLTFRQINAVRFLLYTLVQTAGAFFGAALAYAVYHNAINSFDHGERQVYGTRATAQIFASYPGPHLNAFNGILDQIVATALFCLFIAHVVDHRNRYPSWAQPYVIGTVFVMVGTAFALNAGYPCNPARDFGPRLFTLIIGYGGEVFGYNDFCWFWVPIVGPFIGAVIGGWIYQAAIGFQLPPENEYQVVATGPSELQPVVTVQ